MNNSQTTAVKRLDTANRITISSNISTKKEEPSIDHENLEEKIIDTIFKLPEVKNQSTYIEKQTKGKIHLKIWVADTPDLPDQKYYWIKAGEDNGTNFVTQFNFYVYPDSMRIMYYDTQRDRELTLNRWRQINGM